MKNKVKLLDLVGHMFIHAFLLGPFAMICFIPWLVIGENVSIFSEVVLFFLLGSVICFVLSLLGSLVFYVPGVFFALRKPKSWQDNFAQFMPIFTLIFPVLLGGLCWATTSAESFAYGLVFSAYLTSVLGWYLICKAIEKKYKNSNHAI